MKPLADSAVAQLVITTVYQTIHSLLPLLRSRGELYSGVIRLAAQWSNQAIIGRSGGEDYWQLRSSLIASSYIVSSYRRLVSLRSNRVQKEKIDFLLGLSENLCTEDPQLDLTVLETVLEARLEHHHPGQESPASPSLESCEIIAHNVLQRPENKLAFMALHRSAQKIF